MDAPDTTPHDAPAPVEVPAPLLPAPAPVMDSATKKALLVKRRTKTIQLTEADHGIQMEITVGKIKLEHWEQIVDAATNPDTGIVDETKASAHAFLHGVVEPQLEDDDIAEIDIDVLLHVANEVLEFSGVKEAASIEATKSVS